MDKKKERDKFLIDQTINGEGSEKQMDEVMERAETEPEFRELYLQRAAEQNLMEDQISHAGHEMVKQADLDVKLTQLEEMNREPDLSKDRDQENDRLMEQQLEQQREQEIDR